jgi:transposase InsO family protein
LVSQLFAKESGWEPVSEAPMTVAGIDGKPMKSYRTYEVRVKLTDSWGCTRETTHLFYAVDSAYYTLVLGYPWLRIEDPHIRWRAKRWRFEVVEPDIELVGPKAFYASSLTDPHVYAVCVSGVEKTQPVRLVGAASATNTFQLPGEYRDFDDVFDTHKAGVLPPHSHFEHKIETEGGDPPYGPLYNLSEHELQVLRQYIDDSLAKGWIRPSTSPAGAPVLFAPKKGGGLRLCVDYRGLNRITKKNRYPLPLISETLDRLVGAKKFTKIDLKDAYHRLRIREGDEWKTAFRTRYGHFEYLVMPFGLANAPATFQAYINHALSDLLDMVCVVYLDDILIFSNNDEEHTKHVRMVLERLRQYKLYANPAKCQFRTQEVEFLGFVVGITGVRMEASRISTITEWRAPGSVRELQTFLGFANFYRRFIAGYSRMSAPLSNLLKKDHQTHSFKFPPEAEEAFKALKKAFTSAPILQHFDPKKRITVETDASGFAVGGVLSQPADDGVNPSQNHLHPVAFWSRKLTPPEMNYETHDSELLAIVAAFKHWRHYLEGSRQTVTVITDHNNLKYFMTTKELNGRQARWAEKLARFDFVIEYRSGKRNPADGPSRRPDYNDSSHERGVIALPSLQQKLRLAMPEPREGGAPDKRKMIAGVTSVKSGDPLGRVIRILRASLEDKRSPEIMEHEETLLSPLSSMPNSSGFGVLYTQNTIVEGHEASKESGVEMKLPPQHRAAAAVSELRNATGGSFCASRETSQGSPSVELRIAKRHSRDVGEGLAYFRRPPGRLGYSQPSSVLPPLESVGVKTHRPAERNGAVVPDPFVADIGVCRHRVSRGAIVLTMSTQTAYSKPEESILDMIRNLQQGDAFVREKKHIINSGIRNNAGKEKGWRIDPKGLLRRYDAVFVPAGSAARDEILRIGHDDPLAGHFGIARTKALLRQHWYWDTMLRDIEEYVESCDICQRTKVKRHRPYGELLSLPVPSRPWREISMDFITDLPASRGKDGSTHDALLVIVDRYTKMAKYIPCRKTTTAEELADIFIGNIIRGYGAPDGIVTDRGSLFTSQFWSALCFTLKVKRRLSTAFHPQTDGQTERQNQTIEHYLRCYCTWLQDDWVDYLISAEFSYNNSTHASTGMSPFFALLGYNPKIGDYIEDDVPGGEVPAVRERAERIIARRAELEKRLRDAATYQAKWYNKKHQPKTYTIGDWVMLSTKNLQQLRPSKKIAHRFTGPFKITAIRGKQAYQLELPSTIKVHPTFHVSLLEPYVCRPGEDPSSHPPAIEVEDDEEEWEVETILQERRHRGTTQYLVRWLGWSPAYDQWLGAEDLANAPRLLEDWRTKKEGEESTIKRRRRQ